MPAKLDENTQFTSLGQPLTNGKLFIGPKNGDPKITQIPIFSDEDLTIPLANPQILDADGRPANKIYIPEEYSLLLEDLNEVQKLSDPTAGVSSQVSVNSLTNVQGANVITAEGNPPITEYVDKQQYIFRAAGTNTQTSPTISIDGLPGVEIKRNLDQAVLPGQFQQDQLIVIAYNGLTTFMEWQNQNLKVIHESRGADIGSATLLTLGKDGNYFEVTGTMTITGINPFGVGTVVKLHFQDSLTLTHNATTFILSTGEDLTTEPDDEIEFIEYAFGNWRMLNILRNLGQIVSTLDGEVATGTTQIPNDDTIPQNNEGIEFMTRTITPKRIGSTLKIDIVANLAHTVTGAIIGGALFVDSTANALSAMTHKQSQANSPVNISFSHTFITTSLAELNFKFRGGSIGSSGTSTFNGVSGARNVGGVMGSSIIIEEIPK